MDVCTNFCNHVYSEIQNLFLYYDTHVLVLVCYYFPHPLQPDSGHYYGFAYFRQVKDADIKRGYFQKVATLCHTLIFMTVLIS